MATRSRLTCRVPNHAPSPTVRELIARIHQTIERGPTPEEVVQALADQEALKHHRQPQLPLPVNR